MIARLAWRNVWRNPRRTLVVLSAVIVGVWSMVVSQALVRGLSEQMVRTAVENLTGHVQIHRPGYRADPTVTSTIDDPAALAAVLERTLPAGALWAGRVRVDAVAGNARRSDGVVLVGIDAAAEERVSFVVRAVSDGSLPAYPGGGVLVGRALADRFETRIGNKLIVTTQDASGGMVSRAFAIVGIYRGANAAVERRLVFVALEDAQQLLALGGALSEVGIVLPDPGAVEAVAAALRVELPADAYEVTTWPEALPLVSASVRMYEGIVWLWNCVAFVVMAFGVVNTILMAVLERTRELGLAQALGMRPAAIVRQVMTEGCILLLLGMAAGTAAGLVTVAALAAGGVDLSVLAAGADALGMPRVVVPVALLPDVLEVNGFVLVLGLIVSGYPAYRAARIAPVRAMARE